MPGPAKTPATLKLLRGTFRRDRDGPRPSPHSEPQVELVAPDWLTPGQRASWDYLVGNMPLGMLKPMDRGILQIFCVAEDNFRQAVQKVAQYGAVVKHDGQPAISPFQRIADRQAAILLQASAALGIGPANRGSAAPKGVNPFDRNGRRPPAA
jgi:P27 family predicted phage terminase small subunit